MNIRNPRKGHGGKASGIGMNLEWFKKEKEKI